MMVGKDQSGFPEDLPVLKSLQLFQFLFSHLNTGHWANIAEVSHLLMWEEKLTSIFLNSSRELLITHHTCLG